TRTSRPLDDLLGHDLELALSLAMVQDGVQVEYPSVRYKTVSRLERRKRELVPCPNPMGYHRTLAARVEIFPARNRLDINARVVDVFPNVEHLTGSVPSRDLSLKRSGSPEPSSSHRTR